MSITSVPGNKRSFGDAFAALKAPEKEGFYKSSTDGSASSVDPGNNSIPIVSKLWSTLDNPSQDAPRLQNTFLQNPSHLNSSHEQTEFEQKIIASFTIPSSTANTVAKFLDASGYPEGQVDLLSRGQCLLYVHDKEDVCTLYPLGFLNREKAGRKPSHITKPNKISFVGVLKDFTLQNLRSQKVAVNTMIGGRENGILNYWLNCIPKPVVGVHLWLVVLNLRPDHGLSDEEITKYHSQLVLPFTSYKRSGTEHKTSIFQSLKEYTKKIDNFENLYEVHKCMHVGVSQCKNNVRNPLHYKSFIESYLFCDFEDSTVKKNWERQQWESYLLQKKGAFLSEVRLCP